MTDLERDKDYSENPVVYKGRALSGRALPKLLKQFGGVIRVDRIIYPTDRSPWVDERGRPKPEVEAHFRRQLAMGVDMNDFVCRGGKIAACILYIVADDVFSHWAMYPDHILVVDPQPEVHQHNGPVLVDTGGRPAVIAHSCIGSLRWRLELCGYDDATILGGIIGVIRQPGPWPLLHPRIVVLDPWCHHHAARTEDLPVQ